MSTVIIIVSVLAGLILLYFLIKFITKPKISYKKKDEHPVSKSENSEQTPKTAQIKNVEGLVFEEKYSMPELPPKPRFDNLQSPMPRVILPKKPKKKTLADQINDLSPELKALLMDRGLARKDDDLNSK